MYWRRGAGCQSMSCSAWVSQKNDAGRRQAVGQFAAAPFLDPLHFDVAEMRLAAGVGVEIMYAHGSSSSEKSNIGRLPGGVTIVRKICLAKTFVHHTANVCGTHSAQAQARERASLDREVSPGHALDDRDERVDRWRRHPCRSPQRAHRDQACRHVFRNEFVLERTRRAGRLIGPVAIVSEPPTGFDEP